MAQIMQVDTKGIKISTKKLMDSFTDDIRKIRNKTPTTIAKKLLMLSKSLVPIYTSTLKDSGEVKKGEHGEGVVIVFDATVEQQKQAMIEKFGKDQAEYLLKLFANKNDKNNKLGSNDSYASIVDKNTGFISKAVDLFNRGEPLKMKAFGGTVDLNVTIEIPNRGYKGLSRGDIQQSKRKAKSQFTIDQLNPYDKYQKQALRKARYRYKKKYGVDYK